MCGLQVSDCNLTLTERDRFYPMGSLFIDRQHHGVGWRIDIEPDDLVQLCGELRIVGQLELARPMRLQAVLAPDALHRTDADTGRFGHRTCRPVRCLARWIGQRAGDDMLLDRSAEWRDARRAGLIAQQASDTISHESLLPTPDCRLAGVGPAHDLRRAAAVCREQDDLRPPNVLLWAVPIRYDHRKLLAIGGAQLDCDPRAHPPDSHSRAAVGIPNRTQPSEFIH